MLGALNPTFNSNDRKNPQVLPPYHRIQREEYQNGLFENGFYLVAKERMAMTTS